MARKHFKTNRVCSSENYELSIKVHRTIYSDKWDKLYEEISKCTVYITPFGIKKVLKSKIQVVKAQRNGFRIHFE